MVLSALLACQLITAVIPAAAIQPVQPHSLTEVVRYSFGRNDDRDLDDFPDDWVRRKGPRFPHYVSATIDREVGMNDRDSLRIDVNGAAAIYYSPLVPIDDLHTYFFSGAIKTAKLKHDAALISVSLLDHRRQRLQRVLSRPVTGEHAEWVPLQIGPITPRDEVRFAVIGCHILPGGSLVRDIGAKVWFDELNLGRLPRMELESNFYRHFVQGGAPVEMSCRVSGLDPGHRYHLDFSLMDVTGAVLKQERMPLEADDMATDGRYAEFLKPQQVTWSVGDQSPGYYASAATLYRDDQQLVSQQTTLAVLSLIDVPRPTGEFGWSLAEPLTNRELGELPNIAAQAGINWIKYPLWQTAEETDRLRMTSLATVLDRLITQNIQPVAVLSEPPPSLRRQFAKNWHGVNEIFSLSPEFWEDSLQPVVARYSSSIRYWQIGGERDSSFIGSSALSNTIKHARQRIQQISLNSEIGIPWQWKAGNPGAEAQFVSIATEEGMTPETLLKQLREIRDPATKRWVLLRLAQVPGESFTERAGALARLMLAAKVGGAERIYLDDVYHDQFGLVHTDGSPREQFIPWRTMALLLQDATYLGQFTLPHGSPNAVFTKDGAAFMVAWNTDVVEESLFLGVEPRELDLWGKETALAIDPATGESKFTTGPIPRLFIACNEAVARWRIAAQFASGKMQSGYGGHNDTLHVINTFPQGVSGELTLTLPHEWEAEPRSWPLAAEAGEQLKLPTYIRLPNNANLGDEMTVWDFRIVADRPYRFRVYNPYTVGLDDIHIQVIDRKLPDGRLEIEQVVSNHTNPPEKLDFRCSLFVPDDRRQKLQITKLGAGSDRKYYYVPNADRYRGRELWLRLEQDGGRRVINYRWVVGKDWE